MSLIFNLGLVNFILILSHGQCHGLGLESFILKAMDNAMDKLAQMLQYSSSYLNLPETKSTEDNERKNKTN